MGTTDETVTISRDTYEVLLKNYRDYWALKLALDAQSPFLDAHQLASLPVLEGEV